MRLHALLFLGAAIILALPAYARNLTIALQSSVPNARPVEAVLRQVMFRPFTEVTGLPIDQLNWPGGVEALHALIPGGPTWDVVEITETDLRPACDNGLLEKLDWNAIGGRDHYLAVAVSDCGVGAYLESLVLAWNPQKYAGLPTWSDFWDVAKVPGKRGLARQARDNLEIALLADGMAPGDVYSTLRTNDGVDRAFRKLDQLRPYLVWWGPDQAPTRLLNSGDVLMSSAPADGVISVRHGGPTGVNSHDLPIHDLPIHDLAVQWAGSLYHVVNWAIPKASPNIASANRFLMFAGDPLRQAQLLPFGSVVKGATDKMPPEQLATSPSANLGTALHVDAGFWRENGGKLEARFAEWVGH